MLWQTENKREDLWYDVPDLLTFLKVLHVLSESSHNIKYIFIFLNSIPDLRPFTYVKYSQIDIIYHPSILFITFSIISSIYIDHIIKLYLYFSKNSWLYFLSKESFRSIKSNPTLLWPLRYVMKFAWTFQLILIQTLDIIH